MSAEQIYFGNNTLYPAPYRQPKHAQYEVQRRDYLANARITLAEICKKKMEAMKERERTRTMKGSLRGENTSKSVKVHAVLGDATKEEMANDKRTANM